MKIRGLYAITPDGGNSAELLEKVRAALEGRIALLQYRRKKRNAAEAWQIVELAHSYGVRVVINDDVALALEVGAEAVWVTADPERLELVLGNLLDNAAKYTEPGGRVTVSLEATSAEAKVQPEP